jgi:UDP-glucose 4-epimerase
VKKIFITGGAGFIGSAIVRKLINNGYDVVVYDNLSYGKINFLPESDSLIFIEGDINETDRLRKIIVDSNPYCVYHLAAIHFIPDCNSNPSKALQVNTVGTESVLNACNNNRIKQIIVASTAAVYPINDFPNSEDKTTAAPIDIYGYSKLFCEMLLKKFQNETGIQSIALRLFNAVGPRETNPHVIPHIFFTAKDTDLIPLGNLEPRRDYIHVDDIATAFLQVTQNRTDVNHFDIFNVGSGKEYSVIDLLKMIGNILGRDLKVEKKDDRVRTIERMHLVSDISKIKKTIGWRPKINLEEALLNTAKYYK